MIEQLQKFGSVKQNADLLAYNTYRVEGESDYLISPSSAQDLSNLLKYLKTEEIPYIIIGNGSNIILNANPYHGVVITFQNLKAYEIDEENATIYAEAGASLSALSLASINASLSGLEFAAGIPGSIGGSIYGNAGAYNSCLLDYVSEVTVLDENFNIISIPHEQISYAYRTSIFKETKKYIIIAAKMVLKHGERSSSLEVVADRRQRRVESQPVDFPSAGSVFRNPEGDYAGRLIEACGLKGYKIGGAMVSEKHANFIINYDHATSKDIYNLINYVHDTVKERTNVDLIIEQEFIGWE